MKNINCQITIRSFDLSVIELSVSKLKKIIYHMGIVNLSGPVRLPTKIEKYTVLRSPFVNKKSREQFEMRTYGRLLVICDADPIVVNKLYSFLSRNVQLGVSVSVKKYNYRTLY